MEIKTEYKCPVCGTRMWFVKADEYRCKHCKKTLQACNTSLLAAIKPEAKCQAINIGTGIMVTINEAASLVANILNSRNPVNPVYIEYNDKRPRQIEVFTRRAGTIKATNLLRHEPETSLASGIQKYINWYLGG